MNPGRYPRLIAELPNGQIAMVLDGPDPDPRPWLERLAPLMPSEAVWSVQPARDAAAEPAGGEASPAGG